MENGELGTQVYRRIIMVWEGVVAHLPDRRIVRDLEWVKRRMGLFDAAVRYWDVNEQALKWMWTIMARTELRIDVVVTSREPEFAKAVARLVEDNNWPVRYVSCETAQNLGRLLPSMPDVERVIYTLPEHRWAFGPRGLFLPEARQLV